MLTNNKEAKECFPTFSGLYPLAPSITATAAIALGDIASANPMT